jgi:hypothetical protein
VLVVLNWGNVWVSLIVPPFCVDISAWRRVYFVRGEVGVPYSRDLLWNSRSPPLLLWWVFFGMCCRRGPWAGMWIMDYGSHVGCCVPFEGLT